MQGYVVITTKNKNRVLEFLAILFWPGFLSTFTIFQDVNKTFISSASEVNAPF